MAAVCYSKSQQPWPDYETMGPREQTCKSPPTPPTQEQETQTFSQLKIVAGT